MLLRFSILVLGSQLLIPVADKVPEFNIERGCKVDNPASSLDVGLNESTKNSVRDEQRARDQLQAQCSQFASSGRPTCISVTTEGDGVPPSYVGIAHLSSGSLAARKLKE
jgi:hypothetical protein